MGFSVMLLGAEKLVPAEYWCPYGTNSMVMAPFWFLLKRISLIPSFWLSSDNIHHTPNVHL